MLREKRYLIFSAVLLLVLMLGFVSSVDLEGLQDNLDQLQDTKDTVEKTKEQIENEKYSYLAEQWKGLLLKNKYLNYFDSTMTKIDIIFLIFLGQNYTFGFTFFMSLILWGFMFLVLAPFIRQTSIHNNLVSDIISVGLIIIVSQIGFLIFMSDLIFKIIFYKSGVWPWISFCLMIFAFLFVMAGLKVLRKKLKEMKKREKEKKTEVNREIIDITAKGLKEGIEGRAYD